MSENRTSSGTSLSDVGFRIWELPRRPRVLLLAYACNPEQGSEPGVGWNRAVEAARYCDTWVVCEENRYGPPMRAYLEAHGPVPGLEFMYVPRPSWHRWVKLIPGLDYLSYNAWHRRVYRVVRKLHAAMRFDLVHQVTFCGYREPSYLGDLGVPFIWGPVGGTQNYPWRFLGLAEPAGAMREAMRSVINKVQLAFSPRVRRAARQAAALLAANSTVQQDFARVHRVTPMVQLETGLRTIAGEVQPARKSVEGLRILWSGEFRCWKALPLLIEALAQLPADVRYHVRILGCGPLEERWREHARRRSVDGRLTWLGWLPHEEALRQYREADVLAFTSLRDTSGNVVLEALAAGVPVICFDHQGVRDIVTPECGIKVPVTRPQEAIAGLAEAVSRLARDVALRERLGRGALARAREYLWSVQGERMADVYRQVLSRSHNGQHERNGK